jgi:carbonic anhydrase
VDKDAAAGAVDYKLAQFHFHHKSENTIDGQGYPLCMHMVHSSGSGTATRYAVVTVLFTNLLPETSSTTASGIFDKLWLKIDANDESLSEAIDIHSIIPADSGYVTFPGSLTTPPCTEGLIWYVATAPVALKASQINQYITKIGGSTPGNARPVQPLNTRTIIYNVDTPSWNWHDKGPAMWGSLNPQWAVCDTGREQSPINIPFAGAGYVGTSSANDPIKALTTSGGLTAFTVEQAHGLPKFNCPSSGACGTLTLEAEGSVTIGTQGFEKPGTYKLLQFHFHSSSENTLDGNAFPLCVHMVHCTGGCTLGTDNFAVVTVLFTDTLAETDTTSVAGGFFDKVFSTTNIVKSDDSAMANGVDPYTLIPANSGYMTFKGSLTTPPCAEGLTWFVTAEPVPIKASQILAFWNHGYNGPYVSYQGSNRPVLPLNDRTITYLVDKPWGYTPTNGPDKWGDSYPTCRNGREQSPINIPLMDAGYSARTSATNPLSGLVTSPTTVSQFKSKQAAYGAYSAPKYACPTMPPYGTEGSCGTLQIPGIPATYKLLQAHFHVESENTIDGNIFPMCIHMVHCTASCRLGVDNFAVVTVLFDDKLDEAASTDSSNIIQKLWGWQNERIALGDSSPTEAVDFYQLIPATAGYATFMGSLTTPPCAEGLNWFVALQPQSIKSSQILTYHNHIGGSYLGNARPVQPINHRMITYYTDDVPGGSVGAMVADDEDDGVGDGAVIAGSIAGAVVGLSIILIAWSNMGRKKDNKYEPAVQLSDVKARNAQNEPGSLEAVKAQV